MPRDVTVTLANGSRHVFKNVPDNVTPDQIEQRAARQFPGQSIKAIDGGRKVSRTEAFVSGFTGGFENVAGVLTKAVGTLVDKFGITPSQATAWAAQNLGGYSAAEADKIAKNLKSLPGFGEIVQAGRNVLSQRRAPEQEARPNWFAAGKLTGEVAATAPFISAGAGGISRAGGALARAPAAQAGTRAAKIAQAAGRAAQATGKAIQTGGIGVKATSTAAKTGLRLAGGGISGAVGAAMTDQDVVDAATAGAIIPFAGAVAKHGIGWTYDLLSRRLGKTRAAEIMRNLIQDKGTEIIDALKNAPETVRANTAQWLAKQGLLTPELAAATRVVGASKVSKPLEQAATARAGALEEGRALLRGGETQTAGMGNIAAARQQVQQATTPMREQALAAADVGRTQIFPAEAQAGRLRSAAEAEVARAKRFLEASERNALELGQMDDLGDAFNPAVINKQRGVVGALEQRGGQAAERSLELGGQARAAEEVAANLREQGLKPLDVSGVVNRLRTQAANAEFVNPPRFRLLSEFANNLENRAAASGGVIDATGLYELRKNMGNVVADILGTTDPSALRKYTAQLVGETQPLIDDAIEAAGGKGWKDYLNTFAQGMRNAERQSFERVLSTLPEAKYARVMQGNAPDFVEKFFGPGRYDVNVELMGPKLPGAHALAQDIQAGLDVKGMGLTGISPTDTYLGAGARQRVLESMEPGMKNVFLRGLTRMAGGAPGIYGGGIAAEQFEQEYANKLYENVLRRLAPALAQPSEAARLLQMRPATDYIGGAVQATSPTARNILAQMATGYATGAPLAAPPVEEINGMRR